MIILEAYHPVCLHTALNASHLLLILAFIQIAVLLVEKSLLLKSFMSFNFVNIGLYEIYVTMKFF